MSRLIVFVAVVIVVYLLLRSYRRISGHDAGGAPHPGRAEDMVRCIYCGVHVPRSESLQADGRYYCCEAHRRAHQSPPPNHDAG